MKISARAKATKWLWLTPDIEIVTLHLDSKAFEGAAFRKNAPSDPNLAHAHAYLTKHTVAIHLTIYKDLMSF